MRYFSLLIWLAVALPLAACTPADKPVFGTPVILLSPTSGDVAGPRLSDGAARELTLSWMEQKERGAQLKFASYTDGSFGSATTVVSEPRMFVNWADTPSVTPVGGDHWIAHWLRYSAEMTYSYDVVVSQSFDGGNSWGAPVTAHTDGTTTEHGFVFMYPAPDGVGLIWLDGRNTADEPGSDVLATSMTLRSAVIDANGKRRNEQLVDNSVCDCCQTDVAIGSKGPVAVYRNRTADEVRDIYITRLVDNHWEAGAPLHEDNWRIAGCPVNGPSIVAQGDDVAIAWFTAASGTPLVQVVVSKDGGSTFGEPIEIASGRIAGYAGITILDDRWFAVSWVSRNESGSNSINVRRVGVNRKVDPAHSIAETNQLRVFPQIAYRDESLILAWTDESDDRRQLRVARVPVALP
jgi:hypothetical protein